MTEKSPLVGIFHAAGHVESADCQPVLLILHRAGADGHIGTEGHPRNPVFRIQHLIRRGKPGLLDGAQMQFCAQRPGRPPCPVLLPDPAGWRFPYSPPRWSGVCWCKYGGIRISLSFVCSLTLGQTVDIVHDRCLIVRGAGTDDDQEFVGFTL